MKAGRLKKIPALILILSLMLAPAVPAFAAKPYFKTYGSDVMTGGWFNNRSTCDTSTYYQNPGYAGGGAADDRTGGILAFAKDAAGKGDGGASSQYAAYSLGYVEHDPAKTWGFYTMGANIANSTRGDNLTFANKNPALPASAWGGMFEGTSTQSHCIPDYYAQGATATAVPSNTTLNSVLATAAPGSYYSYSITAPAGGNYYLTSAPATVPANTHINIYVKGNVYIKDNISYGSSGADDAPKLRIVAEGSIYIDHLVSNVDGWYVAQPDTTLSAALIMNGDTGIIWTCHPDSASITDVYIMSNCGSKLTVNGALVAKKYYLDRLNGDVASASASTAEDALAGSASGNIAEVVNFTPAMLLGGWFLGNSSSNGPVPIDSILSLPPIF
jgi:hypothetical protein